MIFMVGLSIVFGIMIAVQAVLLILKFQKENKPSDPEHVSGKTIIELIIMAERHLSDNEKLVKVAKQLQEVDFKKIEPWQKQGFFNLINRIEK